MNRISWMRCACLIVLGVCGFNAVAQTANWPERPIKFVVPSLPGGSADIGARIVARYVETELKQSVVIENVAGAGGVIGAASVKRAIPDGYTFLISGSSTQSANASLFKNLPYHPQRDFASVAVFGTFGTVGVIRKNADFHDFPGFLDYVKKNPGKVSFGYSGAVSRIPLELMRTRVGADTVGVPYKGIAQAITDLQGGSIDIVFADALSVGAVLQFPNLTPIAVTSATRDPNLPSVPMVREYISDFIVQGWLGLSAPAATPAAVVARMNQIVGRSLKDSATLDALRKQGLTPKAMTPTEMDAMIASDLESWKEWVRIAKIEQQ